VNQALPNPYNGIIASPQSTAENICMTSLPPTFASPVIAFAAAFLILVVLLRSGWAARLALDAPNHRSLHATPVPRVGGIAIVTASLSAWLLLREPPLLLTGITAALAMVSYLDDRRGLPIALRLGTHGMAALMMVWSGLGFSHVLLMTALVLFVVWMTNLYNFMDGADGLAGGMTLFGFGFLGVAAVLAGETQFALLNLSIAAAAAAFLSFNFHPARVFMGDAGSIPLGFLAATCGLWGWQEGCWPLWFPLLVFSTFIVDATVTLLKRILHGENFWQAHHEHYYQRLVRMGWGHRKVALAEYVIMLFSGYSALVALFLTPSLQLGVGVLWLIIFGLMMMFVDQRWRRKKYD